MEAVEVVEAACEVGDASCRVQFSEESEVGMVNMYFIQLFI